MQAICYFFGAAAGGFVLMAAIGIQGLVALISSIPMIRRRKRENPEFNTQRAYRRAFQVIVLVFILVVVTSVIVLRYTPFIAVLGYFMGMILAFFLSIPRMSPSHELNRKNFESAYQDCYPVTPENPDDAVSPQPDDAR